MRILIIAATTFEIEPLRSYLEAHTETISEWIFRSPKAQVEILVPGIGLTQTAYHLGKVLSTQSYQLVIQAGIAGAYDRSLELGDVVEVVSECFADLGIEQADGQFSTLSDVQLMNKNDFPFKDGRLWNAPHNERAFLPKVHGLSVNKVHGHKDSIAATMKKYPFAQVEGMEGAAFFYAAALEKLNFLQIRAISNYVESRNKENWEMAMAINNLNVTLIEMLNLLIVD